jgi:hypothetical protein
MRQTPEQGAQTRKQGALTRKQGARIRGQRIRAREEGARLKVLTEKRVVEAVVEPWSAKILGWAPLAGMIFSVTFGIFISIAAICIAVSSTQ